jgi:hypothetical protein
MVTVYKVTAPDSQVTHLHLAPTTWGNTVLERLIHQGYTVQATSQPQYPDTRDATELARRDDILAWAAPD